MKDGTSPQRKTRRNTHACFACSHGPPSPPSKHTTTSHLYTDLQLLKCCSLFVSPSFRRDDDDDDDDDDTTHSSMNDGGAKGKERGQGRGKREEGRGKREEGRGKREEGREREREKEREREREREEGEGGGQRKTERRRHSPFNKKQEETRKHASHARTARPPHPPSTPQQAIFTLTFNC